jgi:general stress protein 26
MGDEVPPPRSTRPSTVRRGAQEGAPVNEPTTTLDERFSDAGASPASWDDTVRALEAAELSWITTVRADGRPHLTPLVAVWRGGALHFCTGADEQKARNLRTNPHVILSTGCNQWDRGLDVVVEGEAVQVTDGDELEQLAEAWRTKWDGRWRFEARDGRFHHEAGSALVFAVAPTKVLAFGKGTFTHTRHRF